MKWSKEKRERHSVIMQNSPRAKAAQQRTIAENKLKKETHKYICECCGKIKIGIFGSGRFCSKKCSNKGVWSKERKDVHRTAMMNSEKVTFANKKRITRIDKVCVICNKKFWVHNCNKNRMFCSKECVGKDIDFKYKKRAAGGYREGSGRGKSGWYNGIQCDSTYELAWVIYHIDHKINFIRNTQKFDYYYKEKKHSYIPDYFLPKEDLFVEVKGFNSVQNEEKIKQFSKKLAIMYKEDLKYIFEYVIKKYGKNFIELYEGNPHKIRNNKCLICEKPSVNEFCSQKCSGIGMSIRNKQK